ncbi:MAG: sugar phosphate nucleotidyltransferase [Promethearchaeota archaeon]
MKSIILAAGVGRRLDPLTSVIPKPMLPLGNKPFLSYIIDGLARIPEITEIGIVIGYLGDQIRDYFGNQYLDKSIRYFEQKELLGTAHAVLQVEDQDSEWLNEDLIVVAGDSLFSQDFLHAIIIDHKTSGAAITLGLEKVSLTEISKGSSCRLKHDFQDPQIEHKFPWTEITEVIEKPLPSEAPSEYNSACIYVLQNEIPIFERIKIAKLTKRQEYEMPQIISSFAEEGYKVRGLLLPERVSHFTDIQGYLNSNIRFLRRKTVTERIIITATNLIQPILSDTEVEIAASAKIGPNVVLGKKVRIGENVTLSNILALPMSVIDRSAHQGIFFVNSIGDTQFIDLGS